MICSVVLALYGLAGIYIRVKHIIQAAREWLLLLNMMFYYEIKIWCYSITYLIERTRHLRDICSTFQHGPLTLMHPSKVWKSFAASHREIGLFVTYP